MLYITGSCWHYGEILHSFSSRKEKKKRVYCGVICIIELSGCILLTWFELKKKKLACCFLLFLLRREHGLLLEPRLQNVILLESKHITGLEVGKERNLIYSTKNQRWINKPFQDMQLSDTRWPHGIDWWIISSK